MREMPSTKVGLFVETSQIDTPRPDVSSSSIRSLMKTRYKNEDKTPPCLIPCFMVKGRRLTTVY